MAHAVQRRPFTTDNYQTQIGRQGKIFFAQGVSELVPVSGRKIQNGQPRFIASPKKIPSGIDHVVWAQDHRRAANQSGINLFRAEVERQRPELQHAIGGPNGVFRHRGFGERRQRSVFDHDAFRIAGGARRINHIGEVHRRRIGKWIPGARFRDIFPVGIQVNAFRAVKIFARQMFLS